MKKTLLAGLIMSALSICALQMRAQPPAAVETTEKTVSFRFIPGDNMFYVRPGEGMADNAENLKELHTLIDVYRDGIISGAMSVYVDAFSTSASGARANRNLSFVRANRVKSELILNAGLKEEHFITKNYTESYGSLQDAVVVTLRIPVKETPPEPTVCPPPALPEEPGPREDIQLIIPQPEPEVTITDPWTEPYRLAVRTNLLYDALLTPTIGIEWRINRHVGVKVDGSWSHWGNEHGRVQKMWLVSPEVRWYLLDSKRFYVGLGANFGEANIYKGLAKALSKDTGYQGNIYGGGVTVGYNLPIGSRFFIDFNLGLGGTHFSYDTFTVSNSTRVYKEHGATKNFWGPTQAGISFVWRICGNK